MRTLIAVLKDSYREAVSGWVLQAMLVIIGLFLLFVLSTSFRLMPLEETLNAQFGFMNTFVGRNPQFGSPNITVEKMQVSKPDEPWASAYQFDIVVTCPTYADFEKARKSPLPVSKKRVEGMMRQTELFEGLTVEQTETPPDTPPEGDTANKPTAARYHVSASGTKITERKEWPHQLVVLFGVNVTNVLSFSPREGAYLAEDYLVSGIGGWIFSLLAVVITAAFVPNMMAKGALDLLISKPASRVWLLVCKYLGGLTFMFLITTFAVLGVYLMIGIRVGVWTPHFLLAIPLLTLQFGILYAVSVLIGVLTRSTLVAILGTVAAWFLLFAFGSIDAKITDRERENKRVADMLESGKIEQYDETGKQLTPEEILSRMDPNRPIYFFIPPSAFPALKLLNVPLPRSKQIDNRIGRLIADGMLTERQMKSFGWGDPPAHTWIEVIGVSVMFIVVMLGLASWRFVTRDG
jgi:hypothetical protein